MTHPTKARRKNPRTGREGGGHARPPQRTATSSPKVSRSQGRDEGAGSEATVPLTARRTGGHRMRSARGRAASRGRLANEGSAHKSQRRRSWGFFLRSAVDHVLGPRARDGAGPHDERWSALRGGTRRVFRDSGRRMRPAPWKAMVRTVAVYPVVALGVRCTPGACRPQGCAPRPVAAEHGYVDSDSAGRLPRA